MPESPLHLARSGAQPTDIFKALRKLGIAVDAGTRLRGPQRRTGARISIVEIFGDRRALFTAVLWFSCICGQIAVNLFGIGAAFPNAKILTRVFDRRQLMAIDGAGIDGAVRETFESSIALGLLALKQIDVGEDEIADVEQALRHLDAERLRAQMSEGDLTAGMDHRFVAGGGRQAASVLETLRERRQAAKLAKEEGEAA
eukprot:gene8892-11297_t